MLPAPVGPPVWNQPGAVAAPPAERTGSPWVVVLTVALAAIVLSLVAVGLRASAGRNTSADVVEVPARPGVVPPSTRLIPSTTGPSVFPSSPSTTTPGGTTGTTVPAANPITPRLKVSDADGRFEVTVPRTWVNTPAGQPDQTQWVPFVQQPNGDFVPTEFVFAVRWEASDGCAVEQCAVKVVERMKTTSPGISPTTTPDTVGGQQAIRIEAATTSQRLVAWVVVEGDRFWVPQLRGPPAEFDIVLTVVKAVVATMSFG